MIKGSRREKNRVNDCSFCNQKFACCDPKNSICDECRKCSVCGSHIKRPRQSRQCQKCQKKNPTQKQKEQLSTLHQAMFGDNNPSKRPEVRKKLSEGKLGKLNPAHKYPEKWRDRILKYTPNKISKLENSLVDIFPEYIQQFQVGWYKIDFANEINKIAIEVQGCWYHSCQLCFPNSPTHKIQKCNQSNDLRKNKFLTNLGWKIIYIAEHDIRKSTPQEIRKLIDNFL